MSPLAARPTAPSAEPPSTAPAVAAPSATAPGNAPAVRLVRPPAGTEEGTAAATTTPRHGFLPDPEPLSSRAWWAYDVRYDRGAIEPGSPDLQCLAQPASTARRLGRFAFELWIGSELIDRVRFDFPLLAGEPPRTGPRRPLREEPSFAPGARVSTRIFVPASPRATRAQILDRATGQTVPVPWPPAPRDADTKDNAAKLRGTATSEPCGSAPVTTTPAAPTPPTR